MKDSRNDFLPYIATADGRLSDLAYELVEFVGRKSLRESFIANLQ